MGHPAHEARHAHDHEGARLAHDLGEPLVKSESERASDHAANHDRRSEHSRRRPSRRTDARGNHLDGRDQKQSEDPRPGSGDKPRGSKRFLHPAVTGPQRRGMDEGEPAHREPPKRWPQRIEQSRVVGDVRDLVVQSDEARTHEGHPDRHQEVKRQLSRIELIRLGGSEEIALTEQGGEH